MKKNMNIVSVPVLLFLFCGGLFAEEIPKEVRDLAAKTADFYSLAKNLKFEVRIKANYETGGQKKLFEYIYSVAAVKPNKLAVIPKSKTDRGAILSDGTNLILALPELLKYSVADAPLDFEEILKGSGGLGIPEHLHYILCPRNIDGEENILAGTERAEYSGLEYIDGIEAHRIKLFSKSMMNEIWIQDGPVPVLARMVQEIFIDGAGERAVKINIETAYSGWEIDVAVSSETFIFLPPANSEKVDSLFKKDLGDEENMRKFLGAPAPDFSSVLLDGSGINLQDYRGKKIVLLDFWATWCGPCIEALPPVSGLAEEYSAQDVILLAVNQAESPEVIKEYLEKSGLDIKVVMDPDRAIADSYNVAGIPQSFIIDKKGIIQAAHTGYWSGAVDELKKELDDIIAGKDVAGEKRKEYENQSEGHGPKPLFCGATAYTEAKFEEEKINWWSKKYKEVYKKWSKKKSAWDVPAREFIGLLPVFEAGDRDYKLVGDLRKGAEALEAKGCDDPLVNYGQGVVFLAVTGGARALPFFEKSAERFKKKSYPAIFSFRAVERMERIYRDLKAKDPVEIFRIEEEKLQLLAKAAGEEKFYKENPRFFLREYFAVTNRLDFPEKERLFNLIEIPSGDRSWLWNVIEGIYRIDKAWNARGGGWANSVTEDGWKVFFEELEKAHKCLTKAYILRPDLPEAPGRMITVKTGLGGRYPETLREWFERAVNAQFDYERAYSGCIWALRPRWGGSRSEVFNFGKECLETKRFDTIVPGFYMKALLEIGKELSDWKEAFKTERAVEGVITYYEGMLKEDKNASRFNALRSEYAVVLWAAGKKDEASKIFNELGDDFDRAVLRTYRVPLNVIQEDLGLTKRENKYKAEVRASSEEKPELAAHFAFDNDILTRWSSEFADNQWLLLNFEETEELSGLDIYWEVAYSKEYEVSISPDGTSWTGIFSTGECDGLREKIRFDKQKVKSIKIDAKRRATEWGNSIWEVIPVR